MKGMKRKKKQQLLTPKRLAVLDRKRELLKAVCKEVYREQQT